MKSLFMNCPECDGSGYVTIDLNDTHIPYEQNPVDFTCMSCDGKCIAIERKPNNRQDDGLHPEPRQYTADGCAFRHIRHWFVLSRGGHYYRLFGFCHYTVFAL